MIFVVPGQSTRLLDTNSYRVYRSNDRTIYLFVCLSISLAMCLQCLSPCGSEALCLKYLLSSMVEDGPCEAYAVALWGALWGALSTMPRAGALRPRMGCGWRRTPAARASSSSAPTSPRGSSQRRDTASSSAPTRRRHDAVGRRRRGGGGMAGPDGRPEVGASSRSGGSVPMRRIVGAILGGGWGGPSSGPGLLTCAHTYEQPSCEKQVAGWGPVGC